MLNIILTFIGGLLKSLLMPTLAYFKGRGDVKLKNAQDILEDVEKSNSAASNPNYDDELRNKYR